MTSEQPSAATSKPCGCAEMKAELERLQKNYDGDTKRIIDLQKRCEGLVEVLENFPDMQDGRSSPEELREAASKWFWDELTPALAAYRKGGEG